LTIGLPVIIVSLALVAISGVVYVIRRKRKFNELLEDWELDYGPQRFKYKNLFVATKWFREKELLGKGGFGKVYRGVLSTSPKLRLLWRGSLMNQGREWENLLQKLPAWVGSATEI
jgi:hypothetical protein